MADETTTTAQETAAQAQAQTTPKKSENITDAQRYQVEDLLAKLPLLRQKTEKLLALLAELKQGTIDRILEMSDEELGWKLLRGELGDLDRQDFFRDRGVKSVTAINPPICATAVPHVADKPVPGQTRNDPTNWGLWS